MTAWRPEYDAVLIEEAVAYALRAKPRAPYWRDRSKVYELEDEGRRNREFLRLARTEFEALELGEPVDHALRERPILSEAVGGCLVLPAVSAREEGAELYVARGASSPARRSMVLRVRASSFSDPERLLALLRHEIYHIADMVDPAFGYDPAVDEREPAWLELVLSRYRVLWDASIDGRLVREGRAPDSARAARRREFAKAFPMPQDAVDLAFRRWFDGPAPSHCDLLAFARDPRVAEPGPHRIDTPARAV